MQPALLIRLQPVGPWRYGPGDGGEDRLDQLYRSDRIYSAVTLAMRQLGFLEPWLEATARASKSAVAFSSLFPFQKDVLFAPPPATLWPPPPSLVKAPSPGFLSKIRWNAARFIPVTLIESIFTGQQVLADQWIPDAESGCLLRRDRPNSSPFRILARTSAAVDRLTHTSVHATSSACVEFEPGSGLWMIASYAGADAESTWNSKVESAFRLLADSGFGAHRSRGWGRTEPPQFQRGQWPKLLMPKLAALPRNGGSSLNVEIETPLFWLLSLYSPSSTDAIVWKEGDYRLTLRGGRIESPISSGAEKKLVRMVSEGSVLAADAEPVGTAVDVAPDGFAHPVYRSGFAMALRIPILGDAKDTGPVETAATEEALESRPCDDLEPTLPVEETATVEETAIKEAAAESSNDI